MPDAGDLRPAHAASVGPEAGHPAAGGPERGRPEPGQGGVFGRRAGRPLRVGQAALVQGLLPAVEIRLDQAADPSALFPGLPKVRLEIGFGGGEHLAHEADHDPETGFIGCEPFRNGVAKLLERIATLDLHNVRIWTGDASLLIARLPSACLAGVDLLYPDPWPKRRQRKRRFVSEATLASLARVMRPGAPLRFATDIDDYAGWTLARILASPDFTWRPKPAGDWLQPWAEWPSTRYEAKAVREGRRPVYLTFERSDRKS